MNKSSLQMQDFANISPKTIWGRVVVNLRERNNIALHIICGDIREVSIENNVFTLSVYEDYVVDLLNQTENANELRTSFAQFGVSEYKIIKKEKQKGVSSDIETLKKYFGDYLKIKE